MEHRPTESRAYDLYVFDGEGGLIIGWRKVLAADDQCALKASLSMRTSGRWELWQDDNLVGQGSR